MANIERSGTSSEGMRILLLLRHLLTWIYHSQLITSVDGGKRWKPEDNIGMLEQLRTADPSAAANFLEHLILQKRSDVREDDRWQPLLECLPPTL